MQKVISIFLNSAGGLLLALASALFLINWTTPINLVPPHEPIFMLSVRGIFWIVGGITAVVALICLFAKRPALPIFLLAGMAISFLIYRVSLLTYGCHSLTGFLGGFSYAFGIPAHAADILIDIILLC